MDVSGVDFPEREKRFEVVYHLLSLNHAGRIRVKTYAGEADAVPSAAAVFRGADWLVSCILVTTGGIDFYLGMKGRLGTSSESSSRTTQICAKFLSLSCLL
jgi:hypothetical protein